MVAGEVEVRLFSDGPGRGPLAWMLAAFLVTFLVTRTVTRMIRAGKGPFRDAVVGKVHVHHAVYGIFLMICTATVEFAYRPPAPWLQILAAAFGVGVSLTLDEFALWLYLQDVYWTREGRTSVDAVFIAAAAGGLLLLGANPVGDATGSGWAAGATIAVNLLFCGVTIFKGKISTGLIGILVPVIALVGAIRLAKPGSPWARRWYSASSRRDKRARERYPSGQRTWLDVVKEKVGGTQ